MLNKGQVDFYLSRNEYETIGGSEPLLRFHLLNI